MIDTGVQLARQEALNLIQALNDQDWGAVNRYLHRLNVTWENLELLLPQIEDGEPYYKVGGNEGI